VAVPTVFELPRAVGLPAPAVQEILKLGTSLGRLAKVSDDLYYPAATIETIKSQVREHIERSGSITVAAFRDMAQTSRKYAVPLLEYLDSVRFTRRHGDDRVLA
jgi:selenocysteine-specific elongation factor